MLGAGAMSAVEAAVSAGVLEWEAVLVVAEASERVVAASESDSAAGQGALHPNRRYRVGNPQAQDGQRTHQFWDAMIALRMPARPLPELAIMCA